MLGAVSSANGQEHMEQGLGAHGEGDEYDMVALTAQKQGAEYEEQGSNDQQAPRAW